MNKLLIGLTIVVVGVAAAVYFLLPSRITPNKPGADVVRIGFSLGTLREERWQRDIDLFTQRAEELGAIVIPAYANDNAQLQITQAESLLLQGVDVLVVVPQDGQLAAAVVEKAHAAHVPVIAYDRLIADPALDLFITFDSRVVGEMEAREIVRLVPTGTYAYIGGSTTDNNAFLHKEGAMRVLDPLIKKGDISLAVNSFSPGWRPDEAYKTMKAYLDSGKTIDAVVAANDGTAGGVIQALAEHDLAGKVPVSGQDADLAACKRLVSGTQAVTIYKPIRTLARQAADDAVALATSGKVQTADTIVNGTGTSPARFLEPVLVTRDTLQSTVIKDGYHTYESIYGQQQ